MIWSLVAAYFIIQAIGILIYLVGNALFLIFAYFYDR